MVLWKLVSITKPLYKGKEVSLPITSQMGNVNRVEVWATTPQGDKVKIFDDYVPFRTYNYLFFSLIRTFQTTFFLEVQNPGLRPQVMDRHHLTRVGIKCMRNTFNASSDEPSEFEELDEFFSSSWF